jgi:hypothetical protein
LRIGGFASGGGNIRRAGGTARSIIWNVAGPVVEEEAPAVGRRTPRRGPIPTWNAIQEDIMMNPPLGVFIVSVVAIAVTDSAVYFRLRQPPERLTIPSLIALIFITILPIMLHPLGRAPTLTWNAIQEGIMMSLPLYIVSVVAIAVTDSVAYFRLRQYPESLTIPSLIAVIIITILPIALTLLLWHQ